MAKSGFKPKLRDPSFFPAGLTLCVPMGLSDTSSRPPIIGSVLVLGPELTIILSMLWPETKPYPPPNYTNPFLHLQSFLWASTFTNNALSISKLLHTHKAPAPMPSLARSLSWFHLGRLGCLCICHPGPGASTCGKGR